MLNHKDRFHVTFNLAEGSLSLSRLGSVTKFTIPVAAFIVAWGPLEKECAFEVFTAIIHK